MIQSKPCQIFSLSFMLICIAVAMGTAEMPPAKYSLSVAQVYEWSSSLPKRPSPPEWVFILGGTGLVRGGETVCTSVSSLKKLIAALPKDSTLDWWPTCHGESEVLKDHIEELKAICMKAGITFTIHPSG